MSNAIVSRLAVSPAAFRLSCSVFQRDTAVPRSSHRLHYGYLHDWHNQVPAPKEIGSLLVTSRFFFPIGFHWSRPHFFGWTLTMAWLVIVGFLTSVPVYSDDNPSCWLLPSGNQTAIGHPPFIDDFPITTSLYRCHIWLPDGALGSWLPWRNPLRRKGRDTGWEWLGTTKDGIIMGLWCDYMWLLHGKKRAYDMGL